MPDHLQDSRYADSDTIAAYWQRTIDESRLRATPAEVTPYRTNLHLIDAYDVRFSGFDGQRIAGWLTTPSGPGPFPTVVEYIGYGGGRGYAEEHILWPSCGFAHFVMDVRGQGSDWSLGVTPDIGPNGPGSGAFLTRGIQHQDTYYYRRLYTDAVLAVDAVRAFPMVDTARIALTGASQGGASAIAVASMRDDVIAVMPDVPAFAAFRDALDVLEVGPYLDIAKYLAVHRTEVDAVFEVLGYFDTAVLAARCTAPALFSLGGRDQLVPPQTITHLIDRYSGRCDVMEYPYNDHEGGGFLHTVRKVEWLMALMRTEQRNDDH